MSSHDEVRGSVSEFYANAVTAASEGNGPCCSPDPKGVAAKLAGYTSEELAALPTEAVVSSFGCGNPLAFSAVAPGDVVLDLGSGAGIDVLLAARKVGPTGRAIGVDMTDEMIVRARTNIAASGLTNVEVRKGLIEDLPVDSASVDWVISNCVINLSPEKDRVFAEIARVLKPGGRMLVSDVVVEDLPEAFRADKALYCSCISGAISAQEYLAGLRRAGLADAEVRERIDYDQSSLKAFIDADLPAAGKASSCCGPQTVALGTREDLAASMVGRVWSAKFFARKPQ